MLIRWFLQLTLVSSFVVMVPYRKPKIHSLFLCKMAGESVALVEYRRLTFSISDICCMSLVYEELFHSHTELLSQVSYLFCNWPINSALSIHNLYFPGVLIL